MDTIWAHIVNGTVVNVIIVPEQAMWDDNGVEDESVGETYCQQFATGKWRRTFPDASKRMWFAGVGFTFRDDLDAFVPPKPATECTLDETTCHWISADGKDLSAPASPR